ncbi:hypothetical protein [Aquimarina sp. 2201CG5-10]|uniref:hypothetical protein n=1 Tax=Aquimarina callyspongiae TaxID=3098150 RepID=UPI002AB4AE9C|nr:hypothetical protein [Aquimarina sp. 2201CG5-10]MDY8137682.1 hypothetical protein [Aquimarina sp. 2201CG5-10]
MKKIITILLIALLGTYANATETKIIVRAKAKDAKFIGSSLGGAYVIIRNKVNQQILAEGKTSGSTGNTNLIMKVPRERGNSIVDEKTAKFLATIDISEPTFISIEVVSPFNNKQAQTISSTELWLIPGKDILGEGIVLEIPGFIIDILKPRTHHYIALDKVKNEPFNIQANMVMMCGCTINKGGLWNSDDIEVKGILKRNGESFKEIDMSLSSTNLFEGNVNITTPGNYELIVYAYDSKSGNTGVDKVNYIIYN